MQAQGSNRQFQWEDLQQWKRDNYALLQEYEASHRTGQELLLPRGFLESHELCMYRLVKRRCQVCNYTGIEKYLRVDGKKGVEGCGMIVVCRECFMAKDEDLPCRISREEFVSMWKYNSRVERVMKGFDTGYQEREQRSHRYERCIEEIWHMVGQLNKVIDRYKHQICGTVLKQLDLLRHVIGQNELSWFEWSLFDERRCKCLYQCCYCDFNLTNVSRERLNCPLNQQKMNHYKKIEELNLLERVGRWSEEWQEAVLEGINRELEMIITRKISDMDRIAQQIASSTQAFTLKDDKRVQQLAKKYRHLVSNRPEKGQQIFERAKNQWLRQGVINQFTHDSVLQLPQEATTITLNYSQLGKDTTKGIKRLSKLRTIRVSKAETAEQLFRPNHKQLDFKPLYQLKSLEFSCKMDLDQQLLTKINDSAIDELHFSYNMGEAVQYYNESVHFPQDKPVRLNRAPLPNQLYSIQRPLKNVWIGQCDEATEVKFFSKTLKSLTEHLMIGQFDGKGRQIHESLNLSLRSLTMLKALFLNEIILSQGLFVDIINKNTHLTTFFINSCQNFNQNCFEAICSLKEIKKIGLVQVRAIQFTKPLSTLTTFILQRYYQEPGRELIRFLSRTTLTHLSLYQCPMVEVKTIAAILSSQASVSAQINYLNLGYTKADNSLLPFISSFPLRTLHLGGTHLNLSSFLSELHRGLHSRLHSLQRLSLRQMLLEIIKNGSISQYHNDLFANTLAFFPILTHLDISHNPHISQRATRFGLTHLSYLTVTNTQYPIPEKKIQHTHIGPSCPFRKGRLSLRRNESKEEQEEQDSQKMKQEEGLIKKAAMVKEYIKLIF